MLKCNFNAGLKEGSVGCLGKLNTPPMHVLVHKRRLRIMSAMLSLQSIDHNSESNSSAGHRLASQHAVHFCYRVGGFLSSDSWNRTFPVPMQCPVHSFRGSSSCIPVTIHKLGSALLAVGLLRGGGGGGPSVGDPA